MPYTQLLTPLLLDEFTESSKLLAPTGFLQRIVESERSVVKATA